MLCRIDLQTMVHIVSQTEEKKLGSPSSSSTDEGVGDVEKGPSLEDSSSSSTESQNKEDTQQSLKESASSSPSTTGESSAHSEDQCLEPKAELASSQEETGRGYEISTIQNGMKNKSEKLRNLSQYDTNL